MARQPIDPSGPGRLGPLEIGATRRKALHAYAAERGVPLAVVIRELIDQAPAIINHMPRSWRPDEEASMR